MDLPRVACVQDPRTVAGLIVGNLLIFVAYCGIPATLFRIARGVRAAGQRMPEHHISRLFKTFIFSCGLTHLLGALNFWLGWYRAENAVIWLTAVVSLATLWALNREVRSIVRAIGDTERLTAALDRHEAESQR